MNSKPYHLCDNRNQRTDRYATWTEAVAALERLYRSARHLGHSVRLHLADGYVAYANGTIYAEVSLY